MGACGGGDAGVRGDHVPARDAGRTGAEVSRAGEGGESGAGGGRSDGRVHASDAAVRGGDDAFGANGAEGVRVEGGQAGGRAFAGRVETVGDGEQASGDVAGV